MLASVDYIKVKGKDPLHLDREIICDGILIKGKVDIATEEKLGVVRIIQGNGLYITDGAEGIENAGQVYIDLATESSSGAMSAEDKKALNYISTEILNLLPQGTVRFNGIVSTISEEDTIDYDTTATDWEGVVWLCKYKMFAAYKTTTTVDPCDCEPSKEVEIKFTYYPHWEEESKYMQTPAESGGLWKDKIYIHGGKLWIWVNCDEELIAIGGNTIEELTDEEVLEDIADFEFVTGGTGDISDIELNLTYPLEGGITKEDDKDTINLSIVEATEEEIDSIFGKDTTDDDDN